MGNDDSEALRQQLRESEEYRSLFQHHPDAVFAFDLEGHFTRVNKVCSELSGYNEQELLAMSWTEVVDPDMIETTRLQVERAVAGESQWFESAIVRKDGRRVDLAATATPIVVGGEVVGIYGIARDVTDRKGAEEALRVSEARFRALVEQSPLATQIYARDGTLLQVNAAWERLWGVTKDMIREYKPLHEPQLVENGVMSYIERGFAGESVEIPPIKYEPERTIAGV